MNCNVCQQEKPLQKTYKRCVECHNAIRRKNHAKRKTIVNLARRERYKTDPGYRQRAIKAAMDTVAKNYDKARARWKRLAALKSVEKARAAAEWRSQNPERLKAMLRDYSRRNMHKIIARNKQRKLAQLRRIPAWADLGEIERFYELAKELTARTGIKHHVDHLVPLNSRRVCGLHTPANLAVVPMQENLRKSNLWWPDMVLVDGIEPPTSALRMPRSTN
jgi:hypothetical protein